MTRHLRQTFVFMFVLLILYFMDFLYTKDKKTFFKLLIFFVTYLIFLLNNLQK